MTEFRNLPPAQLEQLTAIPKAKGFLSREFLTWLWFLADSPDKQLTYHDKLSAKAKRFDLWIDDRIALESGHGLSHDHVLRGGDPSHSQEAGTALAAGKTVRELRLGIHIKGTGDFTALLNEADLNPRSLKLPTIEAGEGEGAAEASLPLATRLKQTEAFLAVLDRLFALFMEQRTSESWESDHLPRIRIWIKKRQQTVDAAMLH